MHETKSVQTWIEGSVLDKVRELIKSKTTPYTSIQHFISIAAKKHLKEVKPIAEVENTKEVLNVNIPTNLQ